MGTGGIGERLNRMRRCCGFDRNELRRDVDRAQWLIGLVLLAGCAVVAALVSVRVGQDVYGAGVRTEHREAATLRRVEATVTAAQEQVSGRQVTVTWTDTTGARRTAHYLTWRAAAVGSRLHVWAGPQGVRDEPPRTHARTISDTAAYELGALSAVGLTFGGLYTLVRRRCDRLRDERWDAALARLDRHGIGR
ncbi:Rv1733c family protein [Actinomadura nitritigenes]|uniref:Rv1733c family protein n=1 Tax=Actinomadura nitritigenes TaxID=134602 RepID=UPI003D89D9E7